MRTNPGTNAAGYILQVEHKTASRFEQAIKLRRLKSNQFQENRGVQTSRRKTFAGPAGGGNVADGGHATSSGFSETGLCGPAAKSLEAVGLDEKSFVQLLSMLHH